MTEPCKDEACLCNNMFRFVNWKFATPLVAQTVKNLPTMWETRVQSLGREDPLEKWDPLATHSSILAWRVPWTEELGGL